MRRKLREADVFPLLRVEVSIDCFYEVTFLKASLQILIRSKIWIRCRYKENLGDARNFNIIYF